MPPPAPVVVIGAGLTGLCCARELTRRNVPCLVLEAADRVGGRIVTDRVDGFLLDRGFQVFLTSYPEARAVLDLDALELADFRSGALVRVAGGTRRLADPWRAPIRALSTALRPVLPLRDLPNVLGLRRDALRREDDRQREAAAAADPAAPPNVPEALRGKTASDLLAERGFSTAAMRRFFRPFFGGVTLGADLAIPADYFLFLFAMFARGSAALPRHGMQAIPEQLARALPSDGLRLQARVRRVADDHVQLADGERVAASHVVVAADTLDASKLTNAAEALPTNGTATLYYAADRSPLAEPILLLAGEDDGGPVNHVCCPSDVQPSYAPAGHALVSASALGVPTDSDADLDLAARRQMREWFGAEVLDWRLLRVDRVARALPRINDAAGAGVRRVTPHLSIAGDHLATPSIQGAMVAGRRAAMAIAETLGVSAGATA